MSSAATTKKPRKPAGAAGKQKSKKFPMERADELLKPERAKIFDPQAMIGLLPLRVYQHIADIGCGPGYFSVPLAKYAFDGRIYSVDIQQAMLDMTGERVKKDRLSNVELVLSKESKIPLDEESVDGALMVATLHEATSPAALLKETARLLRKGGWAAIIDWRKEKMDAGPPVSARLARADVVAAAKKAGFRIRSVYDLNQWAYIILMSR